MISTQSFIVNFNNPFRIVAQQNELVSINQLSATFKEDDYLKKPIEIIAQGDYFVIHPKKHWNS